VIARSVGPVVDVRGLEHESLRACVVCGILSGPEQFAVDRSRKNGRRSVCKSCRAEYDHRRYREITPGIRGYLARCKSYGLISVVVSFTRGQLIARYGDACFYCGGEFEELDHALCVAAGGEHSLDNVRPCCRSCNQKKYWKRDRYEIATARASLSHLVAS